MYNWFENSRGNIAGLNLREINETGIFNYLILLIFDDVT